jgi:hypothetical protein
MPAALLALLLFAVTIDPRLEEPIRLLAEVGAREMVDGDPGQYYADLPESLRLTLEVGPLPPDNGGLYNLNIRTVTVAEWLTTEDPKSVATVLAHELQYAVDYQMTVLGLLDVDCFASEVRGYTASADTARLFWPDELPRATRFEQAIRALVYEAEGTAGLAAKVAGFEGYREACAISLVTAGVANSAEKPV